MLDEERDCQEILQQLSAIRSAVQSASRIFLQEYATACLLEMDQEDARLPDTRLPDMRLPDMREATRGKREKIIQDMIMLLDKAP